MIAGLSPAAPTKKGIMNEIHERYLKCKKAGNITNNGIVFDSRPTGKHGSSFELFREQSHSETDIKKAKHEIARDRDVVGSIKITFLGVLPDSMK